MGILPTGPGVLAGLLGLDLKAQVALRDAARTFIAADIIGVDLSHFAETGRFDPLYFGTQIEGPIRNLITGSASSIGKEIFDMLVQTSMGLDVGTFGPDATNALRTVERAIGFGVDMHIGTGAVQGGLEALLGHGAPKGLLEALRIIPEAVGMNFFLGSVMANIFERATGTPLAEAINEQVRPARLEWPQVNRLLRQHDLTPDEARGYLRRIGFREEDLSRLERLERSLLQVGDLQGLFEFGRFDEATLLDRLTTLGYVEQDARDLLWLYGNKAQTEGGRTYAAVARGEFVHGRITQAEYESILDLVNTPVASARWLVDGALLERTHQSTQLSRADVQQLWMQGVIDNAQAISRLVGQGISENDATLLLQEWTTRKTAGRTGLGTARIIAYLTGGFIDGQKALQLLIAGGMRPEDAAFLVAHPETHKTTYKYIKTPATVESAYLDDVLSYDDALAMLADIGMDPQAASLRMRVLADRKARGSKPKTPHKSIAEAQVIEAYKYGLVTDVWAIRELETLGYSDEDAHLLIAIEFTKLAGHPPDGWTELT